MSQPASSVNPPPPSPRGGLGRYFRSLIFLPATIGPEQAAKLTRTLLFVFVPLLLLVLLPRPATPEGVTLTDRLTIKDAKDMEALGMLTTLVFAALLLERVLEVFVSAFRSRGEKEKAYEVEKALVALKEQEQGIAKMTGKKADTGELVEMQEKRARMQARLTTHEREWMAYKAGTQAFTIRISLVISLIISLVGMRTLPVFFTEASLLGLDPWHRLLFDWVDVMVTAGVIAGGSEGIHALASVYKSATSRTVRQLNAPVG